MSVDVKAWIQHEDAIIAHLFERIEQWKADGRPHPQTYFTEGLERQVAGMVAEARASAIEECIAEVEGVRHGAESIPRYVVLNRLRFLLAPRNEGKGGGG